MLRLSFSKAPLSTTTTVSSSTTATTLLFTAQRHASKSTGSNTKYQAPNKKDNDIGIMVYLGQPVKKDMIVAKQRHRYDHRWGVREPEYHNGKNLKMDDKTLRLTAKTDGIPTIRKSDINPEYEWIDVEQDIQKVYRTKAIRRHFEYSSAQRSGSLSKMNLHHNRENYQSELKDLKEPDWRQRVTRKIPLTERFPDPNLLVRGIVSDITPKEPYYYE